MNETQQDEIHERQRTGLDMYLNATLDDVQRLIPDVSDSIIKGVTRNLLENIGSHLDSASRTGHLRRGDLEKLKARYALIEAHYKRALKNNKK